MQLFDCVNLEVFRNIPAPERGKILFRDFQNVRPKKNMVYRLHSYPEYELIVPYIKPYRCRLDGRELSVGNREFLLIRSYQTHQDRFETDSPFYAFHFGSEEEVPFFMPNVTAESQIGQIKDPELFRTLLERMKTDPELCEPLFHALLRKMLGWYPESVRFGSTGGTMELKRILQAFSDLVRGAARLEDFGTILKMGRSSLNRCAHHNFGRGFMSAYMKYKIEEIQKVMTANPERSVKELADEFGFCDSFHFSRVFKRYAGYPPSKHRAVLERPDFLIQKNGK